MSKKTGQRRGTSARKAPAKSAGAATARATAAGTGRGVAPAGARVGGQASAGSRPAAARSEAAAVIERLLARLMTAVASGDPLKAELETSIFMAIPRASGNNDPDHIDAFVTQVLVEGAVKMRTPDGAALLRLLASLGSPAIKRAASQGLAQLTREGIYPPDWVTEAGKPVPGRAWRRYDVFGDGEAIALTFSYGEAEHALVAQVALTGPPTAVMIAVSPDSAEILEAVNGDGDEFQRTEPISLAEARRRLEEPLARCDTDPMPGTGPDMITFLAIARSRIRRLPADGGEPAPVFTAADRAAAVDEFLSSPLAAEAIAADPEATRFWAEVLTGYSSRQPGEPPGQVGPRKVSFILLGHVPNSFALTPAQRQHLEPAVTAWARWSAARRGLDQAATIVLTERLPGVFGRFDEVYDDPDAAQARSYVADLVTSDADVSWVSEHFSRRMFALPIPGPDDPGDRFDASDPQARRARTEAEFAGCVPPAGVTREQFMAAVHRVVAELWDGDPPETFYTAMGLYADGADRHDVIHTLAGAATPSPAGR